MTEHLSATETARLVAPGRHPAGHRSTALARALARSIERGDLPAGSFLPPERSLAAALGVGRSSVSSAYQALNRQGLVKRHQGRGTWVAGTSATTPTAALRAAPLVRKLIENHPAHEGDLIDLGLSLVPDPSGLTQLVVNPDLLAAAASHGYHPLGLPAARAAIAARFTARGLPTDPDQILVTTGAQGAIDLIARSLVGPGDAVAIEDPTYPGAIDAWGRTGARLRPTEVDSAGIRIDRLRPRLVGAAAVHITPTGHNPTGAVLPLHRRRQLAELVAEQGCWLIEDEALVETVASPPPPMAAVHPHLPMLTIGSVGKLVWGGLRVGWIRSDPATINRLGRRKAAADLGSDALSQLVAIEALDRAEELGQRRRQQRERAIDVLSSELHRRLPAWRWRPPDGGLSVWVGLERPLADELARQAPAHGVAVLAGSATSLTEDHADRIRLGLGWSPDLLVRGLERLARAWDQVSEP